MELGIILLILVVLEVVVVGRVSRGGGTPHLGVLSHKFPPPPFFSGVTVAQIFFSSSCLGGGPLHFTLDIWLQLFLLLLPPCFAVFFARFHKPLPDLGSFSSSCSCSKSIIAIAMVAAPFLILISSESHFLLRCLGWWSGVTPAFGIFSSSSVRGWSFLGHPG